MRMAKSIANERISYKVIPQSLPKSNSSINWLSSGAAAIESGTSKNHYNIYLLFCIDVCKNVTVSVFFYKCAWRKKTGAKKLTCVQALQQMHSVNFLINLKSYGLNFQKESILWERTWSARTNILLQLFRTLTSLWKK